MAFKPRTWVNRHVQFPLRREYTLISDNIYDVKRAEGNITAEGDKFNAENMNDLEQRIDTAFKDANTEIDKKADKTYVDTEIGKKTDKTYVDTALEKKADTSYVNDNFANALKGKEFDSVISVDDVSPIQHNVKCKAETINHFNVNDLTEKPNALYNIGVDNGFTVESTGYSVAVAIVKDMIKDYQIGEKYFLEYESAIKNRPAIYQHGNWNSDGIILTEDILNENVYFYVNYTNTGKATYKNIRITKAQNTPYTPYVDVSNTNVNVCGKNLMDNKLLVRGYVSGITHTSADEQQEVKVSGTATRTIYVNLFSSNPDGEIPIPKFWKGKTLGLEVFGEHKIRYSIGFYDYTVSKWTWIEENEKGIVPLTATSMVFRGFFTNGETYDETVKFMLCIDENAKEFSKFVCADYIPNADGTVNGIKSIAPNMTILSDTDGVNIEAEYNKDINKAFEKLTNTIISLGGNV